MKTTDFYTFYQSFSVNLQFFQKNTIFQVISKSIFTKLVSFLLCEVFLHPRMKENLQKQK